MECRVARSRLAEAQRSIRTARNLVSLAVDRMCREYGLDAESASGNAIERTLLILEIDISEIREKLLTRDTGEVR